MNKTTVTMTMDNSRKGIKNKIKIHYGINDYYKFYLSNFKFNKLSDKENPFIVSKKIYSDVINDYHEMLRDEIINNQFDFNIPFDLGMIGIRKFKPKVGLDEKGNLINRLPVNPRATRLLWDKDPEAKAKKVLVRYTNKHTNGYVFTIHYFKKYKARFKNKTLYSFETVRDFKQQLKKQASLGIIDAYLLY